MRPDEHKRRKNEKYKRKHGITGSNSSEGDSKKTEKENKSHKTSKSGDYDGQDRKPIKQKPKDDGGVQEEPVARRLPDNWERYEEDESEDEDRFMPEMRGEDFNKLISESGGSSSRFRFKDEEDWTEMSDKSYSHEVSLNFDNIAVALDCIPLCERLGLSTDFFTDNQVEEMTGTANDCKVKYTKLIQTQSFKTEPVSDTKEELRNISKEKEYITQNRTAGENEYHTKVTRKSDSNSQNSEKAKLLHDGYSQSKKTDGLDELEQHSKDTRNGDIKQADISSLEDDLDSLLSFDLPSTCTTMDDKKPAILKPGQPVQPKPVTVTKGSINGAEDWLDELLAD